MAGVPGDAPCCSQRPQITRGLEGMDLGCLVSIKAIVSREPYKSIGAREENIVYLREKRDTLPPVN